MFRKQIANGDNNKKDVVLHQMDYDKDNISYELLHNSQYNETKVATRLAEQKRYELLFRNSQPYEMLGLQDQGVFNIHNPPAFQGGARVEGTMYSPVEDGNVYHNTVKDYKPESPEHSRMFGVSDELAKQDEIERQNNSDNSPIGNKPD
ncbi:MAG: hypothetical protein LBK68_04075 [Candidatus Margulisbacteria bacterium]|nr:hypothetical protein [Candidatus Margulisiibacteriota bacterium]